MKGCHGKKDSEFFCMYHKKKIEGNASLKKKDNNIGKQMQRNKKSSLNRNIPNTFQQAFKPKPLPKNATIDDFMKHNDELKWCCMEKDILMSLSDVPYNPDTLNTKDVDFINGERKKLGLPTFEFDCKRKTVTVFQPQENLP